MNAAIENSGFRHQAAWRNIVVFWLTAILVLAVVPVSVPMQVSYADKLVHVVMFLVPAAILAALLLPRAKTAIGSGLFVYGAVIELAQMFLPWRSGEWLDLLANGIGIALGMSLAVPVERLLYKIDGVPQQ